METSFKNKVSVGWLFKMAWRDSRRSRSRLFLFVLSVITGIAALVAIYSLSNNLNTAINTQAAELLGADIRITTNQPPNKAVQHIIDSLNNESQHAEQRSFASMVVFKKNGGSRLVQVKALQGNYPFYGSLETDPLNAAISFRGQQAALVDATLMLQYNANVGDTIQVGNLNFVIAGKLLNAPGQTGFVTTIAPVVYIPLSYLSETGLLQKGSRVSYQYYFNPIQKQTIDEWVKKHRDFFQKNDANIDSVATQKESTSRYFADLTRFLSLVGFIALILGCMGVASAVNVYIKEKVNSIAVLRCLGVTSYQAFAIYFIQIMMAALLGAILGGLLGIGIQQLLPAVLKNFLPVNVSTAVSWKAVGQGILIGLIMAILFTFLPLMAIRKISPLLAVRMDFEAKTKQSGSANSIIYVLIALFIWAFAHMQMKNTVQAVQFTIGIGVALLLLSWVAQLLRFVVRRFFPTNSSYVVRQALANLYRPNNQTTLLMISIGLGTAFISILMLLQTVLLHRMQITAATNQPNMVLFDVQQGQKSGIDSLAKQVNVPYNNWVPIVNVRISALNGLSANRALSDTNQQVSKWLFRREYRVTYRDTLTNTEKIESGKWEGTYNGTGLPHISMEGNYAKRNGVKLGDTLTFNVQGVLVPTIVGSFRKVDWGNLQTNFLVVFPKNVLESAPQFWVLLTHIQNKHQSALFQQKVLNQFPNVSIIDLAMVLQILDSLLHKIAFVIQFMAGLSICTGIIVFVASVYISKYQRIREVVLLRTLGASSKQIFFINAFEYFFLGFLAALTGIILGVIAAWLLAVYIFETNFTIQFFPLALLVLIICFVTVAIGLLNTRGILKQSPLAVLRNDVL